MLAITSVPLIFTSDPAKAFFLSFSAYIAIPVATGAIITNPGKAKIEDSRNLIKEDMKFMNKWNIVSLMFLT